jgi:hypothetical protein
MKSLKLVLVFCISLIVFMSFTSMEIENKISKKNDIEVFLEKVEFPQNGWGNWKTTDCFRGLDFRVKKKTSNYSKRTEWLVQFKNRYNNKINFSYEIVPYSKRSEIRNSERTTNRIDINANTTERSSHYQYLYESNMVYIHVNKVRFGRDGSQAYSNCDQ